MADYNSTFTGAEIDAALNLAKTSTQKIQDNLGRPTISRDLVGPARSGTRLRRALNLIKKGTRKSLRTFVVGDSLATDNWSTFNFHIEEFLKDWLQSDVFYGRWEGARGGIIGQRTGASNSTRFEKTDYDLSWTGSYVEQTSGEVTVWARGNGSLFADKIMIPILQESGAGTLKIEIGEGSSAVASVTYRNPTATEVTSGQSLTGSELIVSADGSGMAFVVLEFADVQLRTVRITETGVGTVRTFEVFFEVNNEASINSYRLGAGSNDFSNETDAATANMGALLAQVDPDIIFVESDDSLASYQNFLPKLDAAISAASFGANPLVVLVGNPGIGSGFGTSEEGLAERIAYCHEYAASRRWDVVDGLALMGGIDEILDNSWAPDQVHLNSEVWRQMARVYAFDRGYANPRTNTPGGDLASKSDIASTAAIKFTEATSRQLTPQTALLQAALFSPIQTGWMTWTSNVEGSGAASKGASTLSVGSGATAASTARISVGSGELDLGYLGNKGRVAMDYTGAIMSAIRIDAMSADGKAYILLENRGGGVYVDGLTNFGLGWRLRDNILDGVAWDGSAQIATTESVTLNKGVMANNYKIDIVFGIVDGTESILFRIADFYVNNALIGSLQYRASSARALGVSVSNGIDSSQNRIYVRPPSVITNA